MSASSSIISSDGLLRAPPAARFLVVFVFALSLGCGLVAAVNVAVDPFGFFGANRTGLFFNDERTFKLMQVRNYPHDALLLGDSRVAYIDPEDMTKPRFFNAAFGGASLDEMLWFWENYDGNARLLVIGLLYADFSGRPAIDEELKAHTWRDYFRYALSFELLKRSMEALERWRMGEPPTYNENGSRSAREKRVEELAQTTAGAFLSKAAQPAVDATEVDPCSRPERRSRRDAADPRWERLQRIADIAERRGVKLVLFMHPRHPDDLFGHKEQTRDRQFVSRINFLCSLDAKFLDFTASDFSDPRNFWLADRLHYKPEVGLSLLTEVLRRSGVEVKMK